MRSLRQYLILGVVLMLFSSEIKAQTPSKIENHLPQAMPSQLQKQTMGPAARNSRLTPKDTRVSQVLWGLHQAHQQVSRGGSWKEYTEQQGFDQTLILVEEKVVIEATAEQDGELLKSTLEKLGMEQASAFGRMVSGLFPISRIDQLENVSGLRFVRTSYRPQRRIGSVTSQGDVAQTSDVARNTCGINGDGIIVGILSDSYNALQGEADGIGTGDLPGPGNPNGYTTPVNILLDLPPGQGIDEGRAMAEIVHDVAPGAGLAFHTAWLGQPSFANGILSLADDAGANVIVDDIGYLNDPFFQDGIIAQAVDMVEENGVTYFSSAGNDARQSYESEFRPAPEVYKLTEGDGFPIGDYVLHDFNPGAEIDVFQRIIIPTQATLSFQWSQPYASICPTSTGAMSDMDIFIFTEAGDFSSALFGSLDGNIGNDPFEFLSVGTDFYVEAYIVIGKWVGTPENGIEPEGPNPNPERIKYMYFGGPLQEEYATNSSTVFGHPNASGAIAVGAVPYFNTPPFGSPEPFPEFFSSAGGTPILLSPCGDPMAPEVREKPEVCGPDGANTTFFFPGSDEEGDGFPNFFGTSASAPHVAGIAALMKQASADLSPSEIEEILQNTAIDMDDPFTPGQDTGFDFGTGYGFVQAFEALSALTGCAGIASLELYDAEYDYPIKTLSDGAVISYYETYTKNLAIKVNTVPEKVGSVVIKISGGLTSEVIENNEPYASFGNQGNDFKGRKFDFGIFEGEEYTVEATAYSLPNAQGEILNTLSLSFFLLEDPLQAFSLINATTDEEIRTLFDFEIIDLSLTGSNLNIRANSGNEQAVGSVQFTLVETDINIFPTELVLEVVENTPPFALFGNVNNDYRNGSFEEGFYLLTATPYSEKNLQGTVGRSLSLIFAVSEDGMLPVEEASDQQISSWTVFPNSLDDRDVGLQVRAKETGVNDGEVTFKLLNQFGDQLYQEQTQYSSTQGFHQINTQSLNLSPGLYYLRVEIPDKSPEVFRILKN